MSRGGGKFFARPTARKFLLIYQILWTRPGVHMCSGDTDVPGGWWGTLVSPGKLVSLVDAGGHWCPQENWWILGDTGVPGGHICPRGRLVTSVDTDVPGVDWCPWWTWDTGVPFFSIERSTNTHIPPPFHTHTRTRTHTNL